MKLRTRQVAVLGLVSAFVLSGGATTQAGGGGNCQTRVRLEAQLKSGDASTAVNDAAPTTTEVEAQARFESEKGRVRLGFELQGFAANAVVQAVLVVSGANVTAAMITVDGSGFGEVRFDETDLPAGIPATLTAGTVVKFLDQAQTVLLQGPLEAR